MKVPNQAPTTFITARFDTLTESRLLWMRKQMKEYVGKTTPKYPPHITLYGVDWGVRATYDIVRQQIGLANIRQFPVELNTISAYPVLRCFSIPIGSLNSYLYSVQAQMDYCLRAFISSPQFGPEKWKPHVTLIKDLQNKRQRNDAATCVSEKWEPIKATVTALGIMQQGTGKDNFTIQLETP